MFSSDELKTRGSGVVNAKCPRFLELMGERTSHASGSNPSLEQQEAWRQQWLWPSREIQTPHPWAMHSADVFWKRHVGSGKPAREILDPREKPKSRSRNFNKITTPPQSQKGSKIKLRGSSREKVDQVERKCGGIKIIIKTRYQIKRKQSEFGVHLEKALRNKNHWIGYSERKKNY